MILEPAVLIRRWLEDPEWGLLVNLEKVPILDGHGEPSQPASIDDPTTTDVDEWEQSGANNPAVLVDVGEISVETEQHDAAANALSVPLAIRVRSADQEERDTFADSSYTLRAALQSVRTLFWPTNDTERVLNGIRLLRLDRVAFGRRRAPLQLTGELLGAEGIRVYELIMTVEAVDDWALEA